MDMIVLGITKRGMIDLDMITWGITKMDTTKTGITNLIKIKSK